MHGLGFPAVCGREACPLFLVQLCLDLAYKFQKVIFLVDAELLVYVEGVSTGGAVGYAEFAANVGTGEALR